MYGHKDELEYVCSFNTGLTPPEIIGLVAEGHRITAYHTGGQVSGPKLRGKVLPVGGDWATLRTDGLLVVDVRTTIQTDDEVLLYLSYGGLIDARPEGYQMFLAGTFPPVLLSAAQVCNALGVSETNHRVLLHRACSRVRAALGPYLSALVDQHLASCYGCEAYVRQMRVHHPDDRHMSARSDHVEDRRGAIFRSWRDRRRGQHPFRQFQQID